MEIPGENIQHVISLVWSKGLPFAVWRHPYGKKVHLLVQTTKDVNSFELKNIDQVEGFVVAPFQSAQSKRAFVLQPGYDADVWPSLKEVGELPSFKRQVDLSNRMINKEDYLVRAQKIIRDLKEEKLKKVVLSRVIEVRLQQDLDAGKLFTRLNETYENSFNYLFYIPELGSWTGASPELFLRMHDGCAETVSLAGTKPMGKITWTPKEIEEQQIVTAFISNRLQAIGVKEFRVSGPDTLMAGNIGHLSTRFTIPVEELKNKTGQLINQLHPTPAVCGMPQQKAYAYICQAEDHQRKCYAGFLGPWNMMGSSALYVNLRCAAFDKKKLHLFVGGGLTASSVAEAEWEETEHKSKTLLSVLENF